MLADNIYIAPFFSNPFFSLEDAKWNIKIAFTRSEVKKYFSQNEFISHYIGDRLQSVTPIKVDDNGNISFGKTCKV